MEHSSSHVKWFLVCGLHGTFVLSLSLGLELPARAPTSGNELDHLALLAFKSHIIQDPLQIMSSWNDSLHFCNWAGVTCNPSNGRVMILNLEAQKLVGSIPSSIGNLSLLTGINLKETSSTSHIEAIVACKRVIPIGDFYRISIHGRRNLNGDDWVER